MTPRLNVTVDHRRCVGTSMCVMVAARSFALDPEGLSVVVDAGGDPVEVILNAAEQCPMSAITVRDADTGAVLFGG